MWALPHCRSPKMTTPGASRSLQILLGALSCFSLGTQSDPAQNRTQKVNGIVGGSASLLVHVSTGVSVVKTEWHFAKKGGTEKVWIATFGNGEFDPRRGNLSRRSDRFKDRLEVTSETMLRIKDLEMEDSGEFTARVRLAPTRVEELAPTRVEEHRFSLSVSEPVPEPRISLQQISGTPGGCNVTLRCWAFGKGTLNISWEAGNPLRKLEGGSVWYQLSENGSELKVSWQLKSVAPRFSCLASSSADRKKVSVDLESICRKKDPTEVPWWMWLVGALVLLLAASLAIWLWKRTSANRVVSSAEPQKGRPSDPLYDEIPERESPPAGADGQRPGISAGRDPCSPMNSPTVYTFPQDQLLPTNLRTVYSLLQTDARWPEVDT